MPSLDDFVTDAREELADLRGRPHPGSEAIYARLDAVDEGSELGALGVFLDAAVESSQIAAREARARPVPGQSGAVVASTNSRGRFAWWVGVGAAAAFLVALGTGLVSLPGFGTQDAELSNAAMHAGEEEASGTTNSAPAQRHGRRQIEAPAELEERFEASVVEPDLRPARAETGLAAELEGPRAISEPSKPKPRRRPALADRLADLDAQAQASWRKGDEAGARDRFGQLIDEGGTHPRVQLAFGDLFTLARHAGEDEAPLWSAYLERFPRGRYADDARAGLCRRAPQDGAECWRHYLQDFAGGAHARDARRALKSGAKD